MAKKAPLATVSNTAEGITRKNTKLLSGSIIKGNEKKRRLKRTGTRRMPGKRGIFGVDF